MQESIVAANSGSPRRFWSQYREASLNWLALGLLLAAWNAADNDAGQTPPRPESLRARPESLRGYSSVSVRAVTRSALLNR